LYRLDNRFASHDFRVVVVGCGGTGGYLAEGLCRILPPNAQLVLLDHDRVEERNLIRQNFTREDLGGFKSEVLARKLSKKADRPVGYCTLPVGMVEFRFSGLVLGCVDNGPARRDIEEKMEMTQWAWWVDSGNGENYGQILIGNSPEMDYPFRLSTMTCYYLPLPTIQVPNLLLQAPRVRSCAEAVEAGEQGPTINQVMASLMLEVARRIIGGTCSWMQLFVDMDTGSVVPVMATPDTVSSITGVKKRKLEFKD